MRTFGSLHSSTIILAAAASLAAAPLAAQSPAESAPTARVIPARCVDAACGGNYQLAIVAALYPYDDGSIRGPSVLTLVIENRGATPAPLASLEVAPVAHFTNAAFTMTRRAPVAALLPGERTVVEIPLTLDANGGAPCLAISVSPSIIPTPAQTQFYAAAPATRGSAASSPGGTSFSTSFATSFDGSFGPPPFVSIVDDAF